MQFYSLSVVISRLKTKKSFSCFLYSRWFFVSLNHGCLQSFLDFFPIYNLPHLSEILWSHILVIQVVSVLPNVDVEKWTKFWTHILDHVLVGSPPIRQCTFLEIIAEPSPARTLDGCGMLIERLNEFINWWPWVWNRIMEIWSWLRELTICLWAQWIPEELMVDMATCVEMNELWEWYWTLQITLSSALCLLFK